MPYVSRGSETFPYPAGGGFQCDCEFGSRVGLPAASQRVRPLKPTGLFRLLLLGDPGPVEDLTGELPQLFGSAAFISLDDKERGMKEDHQLPSLPCLASAAGMTSAILALIIAASRSRISIRRVVTASPLRCKS